MFFRRLTFVVILGAISDSNIAHAAPARSKEPELCRIAIASMHIVSDIRGLRYSSPVPCIVQNRPEVLEFLRAQIAAYVRPERIEAEELLYKSFRLLPNDFDYLGGLLQLYTAQLGGYYDQHAGRYVMAAWLPPAAHRGVAIHELAHALQDQHYKLSTFLDFKQMTTDELMARLALAEGDATAVMFDDMLRRGELKDGGRSLRELDSIGLYLSRQMMGAIFSSSIYSSPSVLQAVAIFPYMSGTVFVHKLLRQGGYAEVDSAFKKPPRSTAEILDFEKFRNGEHPEKVTEASHFWGDRVSSWQVVSRDRLGQFLCGILVTPKKDRPSCYGWRGDEYVVFKPSTAGKTLAESERLLSIIMKFESAKAAADYAGQIDNHLQEGEGKQKAVIVQQDSVLGILVRAVKSPLA